MRVAVSLGLGVIAITVFAVGLSNASSDRGMVGTIGAELVIMVIAIFWSRRKHTV